MYLFPGDRFIKRIAVGRQSINNPIYANATPSFSLSPLPKSQHGKPPFPLSAPAYLISRQRTLFLASE